MPNQRLRDALLRNTLGFEEVAKATGVDPKTVERWITQDRTPYPRHRHAIHPLQPQRIANIRIERDAFVREWVEEVRRT